jgi:hypothetical protein
MEEHSPAAPERPVWRQRLAEGAWLLFFAAPGLALGGLGCLVWAYSKRMRVEHIGLGICLGGMLLWLLALQPAKVRRWLLARRWPLAFSAVVFLATLVAAEYVLEHLLLSPPIFERGALFQHDPEMGYAPIPGARVRRYLHGVYDVAHQINSQGTRGAEIPFPRPHNEKRRILAVGCSMTFGAGAEDDATWPALLEKRLGADACVMNGAVISYGPQQMFLRARRLARTFQPDVIFVPLIEHHLFRLGVHEGWNDHMRQHNGWNVPIVRVQTDPAGQRRVLVREAGKPLPPPRARQALLRGRTIALPQNDELVLLGSFERGLKRVSKTLERLVWAEVAEAERLELQTRLNLLRETLEACAILQRTGPRVVVVLLPEPEIASTASRQEFARVVQAAGREFGLEVWDIGSDAARHFPKGGRWRLHPFYEAHYAPRRASGYRGGHRGAT